MPETRQPLPVDLQQLQQDRRWMHAHPELAFAEVKTSAYVQQRLEQLGIRYTGGIAGTGIVATLEGRRPGRVIGLRADMDALPMEERNGFEHRSRHAGCMHGCGHDGHTAILLGVAAALAADNDFAGSVRLIFQPAEEGHAGARRMIEAGLFERFPVDELFALHNWPDLPAGAIGVLSGSFMASSHYLGIELTGAGGHGGMPHLSAPLMTVAAHIQLALNSFIAQRVSAQQRLVISLAKCEAGSAIAALPSRVSMEGSIRCLDKAVEAQVYRELPGLIEGVAAAFGVTATVKLLRGYPITRNAADSAAKVERACRQLGYQLCNESSGLLPSMASEDFSFMLNEIDGSYFWLGQQDAGHAQPLHSDHYDFNDEVIAVGVAMFCQIVRNA